MSQISILTHEEFERNHHELRNELLLEIRELKNLIQQIHSQSQQNQENAMISKKEIMDDLGISPTTFWRYVRDGFLPPPSANSKKYNIPRSVYNEWRLPKEIRKKSTALMR